MGAIAIVGGTGFLGRHVVEALAGARALSRRTGFDLLRPDPEALRGCEAVVNLAGIKREEGPQTFRAVHVEAVERLVAAMKAAGVRRLVHVSVVVARPEPGLPYHDTKWKGEEVVRASGLDWTILRPAAIYGRGDDLLSHLSLMIRASPVFPIVGDGSAPMMPVDARDVAAAVAGALREGASVGRTYDVVGGERLTLREVVLRVAEALELPVSIWKTPAGLMKLPVSVMEKTMRRPLSTRAQLAMLVEGLAGDPEPARELGVRPAPFTARRLRPLLPDERPPVDLRLFSAPRRAREVPAPAAWGLYALAAALMTAGLGLLDDRWLGMTVAMGALLPLALLFRAARSRLRPTAFRVAAGLAGGVLLYGLTRAGTALLSLAWPGWESGARSLMAWRGDHSGPFLLATLVPIILSEELLWRGVVLRFAEERWGRPAGLAAGALLYAAAHAVTLNPVLLLAAFCCGLFWGWLFLATDDLTAPFVCHLAWDGAVLFLLPLVR